MKVLGADCQSETNIFVAAQSADVIVSRINQWRDQTDDDEIQPEPVARKFHAQANDEGNSESEQIDKIRCRDDRPSHIALKAHVALIKLPLGNRRHETNC